MKVKNIFALAVGTIVLASCAVTTPFRVTNNEVGTKIGRSNTLCIGSIQMNKKFGIIDAAKKGKISKIGVVDIKIDTYIPGLIYKKEFIVSGE